MTMHQDDRGQRKERVGIVVSDKMEKTVVVAVENFRRHRIYKKVLRRTARYKAHDETNEASLGDLVRIVESRPLSRLKRWRLKEIVQRHDVAETKPSEIDQTMVRELEERGRRDAEASVDGQEAAGASAEQALAEVVEQPEVMEAIPEAEPKAVATIETPEVLEAVPEAAAEPEAIAVVETPEDSEVAEIPEVVEAVPEDESVAEPPAKAEVFPIAEAESAAEPVEGGPVGEEGEEPGSDIPVDDAESAAEPAEGAPQTAEHEAKGP